MYTPLMHHDSESYDLNCVIPKESANLSLQKYKKISEHAEEYLSGRILDVGCGQGAVTQVLCSFLNPGAEVDATDISANVLEYARRKYKHLSNVNFFQLDACSPLPERLKRKYDLVFSNFLFHWLKEHRTMLNNFSSALKDGGECIICFFGHNTIWSSYREMSRREPWSQYMADCQQFIAVYQDDDHAADNFKTVILECGFKSANVENRHIIFTCYKTMESMEEILKSVDPFLPRIPVELRDRYFKEFMETQIKLGAYPDYDPETHIQGNVIKTRVKLIIGIASK